MQYSMPSSSWACLASRKFRRILVLGSWFLLGLHNCNNLVHRCCLWSTSKNGAKTDMMDNQRAVDVAGVQEMVELSVSDENSRLPSQLRLDRYVWTHHWGNRFIWTADGIFLKLTQLGPNGKLSCFSRRSLFRSPFFRSPFFRLKSAIVEWRRRF